MKIKNFRQGLHNGIPIALAYFAVSFTFGIMSVSGGLTVGQATLISLTNLTSAGQFAGLDVIIACGSYWEIALTQLVINLRYLLMSFSLSQKLEANTSTATRSLVAFGITDEIFGVSASRLGKLSPYYSYGLMCMAIPGWTIGTLIGAVCGNILPATVISALSIAIYGMFTAIIFPPARKNKKLLFIIIIAMALSSLFYFAPVLKNISSGFTIIIITVAVSALGALLFPIKEEDSDNSTAASDNKEV